ncbi:hypothetical protein J6590_028463 [Homalodisca vitripennis]|nr:hypothetical protein J6590_028463 [Homalodisca vitripennis]
MNRLPNFVHPSVEVNRMISIPPEPLSSPRADGFLVDIPIPNSHSGPSPLSVRLLSAVKRQHMVGSLQKQ